MASLIWDIANNNKSIGYMLNSFLYDGRVKEKFYKPHTEQEYRDLLEDLRVDMFNSYNEVSDELGWDE